MKHQHPMSHSRVKGCLNTRSIQDLKYGMTEKCLKYCFRDIMPISKNGDMNSRLFAQRKDGLIFLKKSENDEMRGL